MGFVCNAANEIDRGFAGSGSDQMLRGLQPETFASFDCEIGYQKDAQNLKYKSAI